MMMAGCKARGESEHVCILENVNIHYIYTYTFSQESTGEMKARTQKQEEGLFNNEIKQR